MPAVGRHGGRFVLSETNNPRTFNAMMATETSTTDVTDQLFGFLVDFDNGTQQYGPRLAKSWEVAPDGVTWTFHLRRGARFSDGHPITAADVLFSLEVVYDERLHPVYQESLQVGGQNFTVTAPDEYTIVINTESPMRACSMRSVRAIFRSYRSTCSSLRSGTAASPPPTMSAHRRTRL